jgi:hypothetical protein
MGNNDSILIKSDYNLPINKELSYNKEKINITNLKSPLLKIIFLIQMVRLVLMFYKETFGMILSMTMIH